MKEYTINNQYLAEYHSKAKVDSVLKDAESEDEKETEGEGEEIKEVKQPQVTKLSTEKKLDVSLTNSRRKTVGDTSEKGINFSDDVEEEKGMLHVNKSMEPRFHL